MVDLEKEARRGGPFQLGCLGHLHKNTNCDAVHRNFSGFNFTVRFSFEYIYRIYSTVSTVSL